MKIIAPNKNYTGLSAGIGFVNGVGETDDPERIAWFRRNGYEVVEPQPPVDPVETVPKAEYDQLAAEHEQLLAAHREAIAETERLQAEKLAADTPTEPEPEAEPEPEKPDKKGK